MMLFSLNDVAAFVGWQQILGVGEVGRFLEDALEEEI